MDPEKLESIWERARKKPLRTTIFVIVATLLALSALAASGYLGEIGRRLAMEVSPEAKRSRGDSSSSEIPGRPGADKLPTHPEAIALRITSPVPEAAVGPRVQVHLESRFPDKNHYILVRAAEIDELYVVRGPFRVSPRGLWSGSVRLGSGEVGRGQAYEIFVLATTAVLHEGPLAEIPFANSEVSEAIPVIRKE